MSRLAEHEPEQGAGGEAEPTVEEVMEQARVGIEALTALVPVLEGEIEAATSRDLRAALANLQLAYADAAG